MGDLESDAARLVHASQAGDQSAFAELYQRYCGLVQSIARLRLPRDDIADAVQETFYRALRRLKTLRQAEAFAPWLAAIARNVVRDVERERATPASKGDEPRRAATQEHELQARAAMHAIRSLPKAYRATIAMRVVHGMTGPEIAGRTGLSEGSVRVNLHRGMKLLRERLKTSRGKKSE
ncbi:MAG TPA: sigma-70 family RNA polymerase sigma factor [Vicinamibacterales bacterium]|nr:sigma-70 family RNA polymerase sigma factor [Vicinamibacterales bacterium]